MRTLLLFLVLLSTLSLGGCSVVGDIFQAGMVVGVIVVLLVIGVIVVVGRKFMS